jgi:hypothetical protein
MAIKIARNEQGNCINFYGSSNPTHWNACLSGQVDAQNSTLVNIVNDITTSQSGITQYEFFNIPYTEFLDEDSNSFANAQEVADYVTLKGNVTIGTGVSYKGIWNPDTNTPDITTDVSGFANGDFYNVTANGTHDLGSGDVDFINGDEVIFDGTDWQRKPYAGALIEYDSTSVLLNNNAAVYADGSQGLEEPNGAEDGWYFKNDEAGKKINWYFLGNENAGYQMNKATLQGGYARIKVLTAMGSDSPFMSLYTTPKGDGFDAFWFRSRYSYIGDFTGINVNQEVIVYWGEDPSVHPELTRVQLSLDSYSSLLSTAPDISEDAIYTMALGTNSSATVDSIEFIAKELGYKNQQYLRSYLLEAKLENIVVPQNDNDLTGEVIDFKLDDTSTSIMLDNGYSYGVNTIKAVDTGDGLITIKSIQGDLEHWIKLDHTNVTVNGESVSGGLNDVINTLNELYTVGAFQSVVISDPYSTMIADVDGVVTTETTAAQGTAIETGTDEYGATTGGYNAGGYKTPETINQAGEYFTFDIRNEGTIGFGLIPSDADYANGDFNGNSSYADPSSFCNGPNSGHYGYQFSHWFHPSPNGPWTNYGANTSYSMREGWSNANFAFSLSPEGAKWLAGDLVKIKVGIDENNFIVISYFDESTSLFVPIARTSYPVPNGLEYHLGIKFGDTTVRLVGLPKIHELEDLAPTMNFRYIESPDGVFHYPLFTTAEEAEYYDEIHNGLTAGTGSSHTHTYADDPTNTTWYMPEASHDPTSYTYSVAPDGTQTFSGNVINWTEVTSLTNADLTPPQFSSSDYTYEEGTVVNLQVTPAGASWNTSVSITPSGSGLVYDGYSVIQGTLNDVSTDTIYTVSVTRANSYGSTIGTFEIQATDVPPVQTNSTPWTKALDFNGSSEHTKQVSNSLFVQPLQMGGLANLVDLGTASQGSTSNHSSARPWATACVFKADRHNSTQVIWNQGEGSSNGNDNISLVLNGNGDVSLQWGRQGTGVNTCRIAQNISSSNWYGVSIAHNGVRLGGGNASASNLANCFDIRLMSSADSFVSISSNLSTSSNWISTGQRMDRTVAGDFTIGGRGSSTYLTYHGKVASMVVTPLLQDGNYNSGQMPEGTMVGVDQAKMMITDPIQWVADYRSRLGSGNPNGLYRKSAERYATNYFTFGGGYQHVQVWLMGDGSSDSYANGIRNYINPSDQNYVKLQLNSMVSNDIETVNINGLT